MDYYKTLGIPKTATREEIKKAYKKLAKQYHPDVNKLDPQAEHRFKEINEAASILGDDEKRRQYDAYGHDAFTKGGQQGAGFDYSNFDFGSTDFGDIFESFFGLGGRRSRRSRGSDLRYDLELSLEEAAEGVKRKLSLRKRSACDACHGSGGSRIETCTTCHGTGYVRQTRRTPFGMFQTTGPCAQCEGEGRMVLDPCSRCNGSGTSVQNQELEIEIPAGVEDNMRLRVTGEGEASGRGGRAGDLYVFISVKEHQFFQRDGNDILIEVPISFFQATFGGEITVPTLEGKAKLKVPGGSQSGTLFRLRGKGMRQLHGSGTGDELVRVQVVTPKKLSLKQEKLLREAAKEFGDPAKEQKSLFERLKAHLS